MIVQLSRLLKPSTVAEERVEDAAKQLTDLLTTVEEEAYEQLVGRSQTPMNTALERYDGRDGSGAGINELGRLFLSIGQGRLLIVGEGGSGKTVMLIQLARDLLTARRTEQDRNIPIPVRLSLASWDIERQTLKQWLIAELAKRDFPAARAELLIDNGVILPLLDGLDEMDPPGPVDPDREPRSRQAFAAFGDRSRPVVLTCRTDVYEVIRESLPFEDGFVGRVAALTAGEIHTRLAEAPRVRDDWRPVLVELSRADSDVLTELATPWRLSIVIALYGALGDRIPDPRTLIEDIRHPDRMLARYAERLLDKTGRPHRLGRTLGTIGQYLVDRQFDPREAYGERQFGFGFVVHRLWPIGGNLRPRVLSAVLSVLLWIPSLGAALWVLAQSDFSSPLRITAFVTILVVVGLSAWLSAIKWPHPRKIDLSRLRRRAGYLRLAAAVGAAAVLCGVAALLGRPWFGCGLAVGYVGSFGAGLCLAVRDSLKNLRILLLISTLIGVVLTVAAWLLVGTRGFQIGIVAGVAVGGFALIGSVPFAIRLTKSAPGYIANPVFKTTFVRDDFILGLISGTLAGLGIYMFLESRYGFGLDPVPSLLAALAVLVSIGPGTVAQTWLRHVAMVLSRPGSISLFLDSALRRAYQEGLLRRSGIAYEFRHAELRDYFAGYSRETGPDVARSR